jgi:hypothetical protein
MKRAASAPVKGVDPFEEEFQNLAIAIEELSAVRGQEGG